MGDRPHVRYSALPKEDNQYYQQQRRRTFGPSPSDRYEEEDRYNYDDPRFHYEPKQRIPWKSVALALFLLSFGSLLLLVSYFLFIGHMGEEKPQASGFLVIGFLMFLPGMHSAKTPSLYSN